MYLHYFDEESIPEGFDVTELPDKRWTPAEATQVISHTHISSLHPHKATHKNAHTLKEHMSSTIINSVSAF